jgi:putative Holliday junction resolvase
MSRLGRRLAFDYGDVRIGVAVCDADGILSTPLETLASKHPSLMAQIKELVSEHEPVRIYVGEPLNLSGQPSESSVKARAFAQLLQSHVECDVQMVDERLTTVTATKRLSEAGVSARELRKKIDSAAAVEILENGLARDRG